MNHVEIEKFINDSDLRVVGKSSDDFIRQRISQIKIELGDAPVFFYGVGGSTHRLFERYNFSGFNIQGFLDIDQEKHSRLFQGKRIFPPEHLKSCSVSHVVICAKDSRFEIKRHLESNFNTDLKIFLVYDQPAEAKKSIPARIYKLQRNLDNREIYEELIDLYLYVRDFDQAIKCLEEMTEKRLSLTSFQEDLLSYLKSYPRQIKESFKPSGSLPNICLITLDTARSANLQSYGYSRMTMPFLSELAERSIICEKAYSTSNWTVPSHGSIFTGKMPFDHGACTRFSKLADSSELLARKLKVKGYSNYGFTNIPFLHPRYGFDRGFDLYKSFDTCNFASRTFWEAFNRMKRNEPFFLFLNFIEAHDPYECTDYQWGDIKTDGEQMRKQYNEGNRAISPALIQDTLNVYDDGLRCMDRIMKYYFDAFPENTIFVITSDHGELFGEHGMCGHMNVGLYENVIKVPLIISGASVKHQNVKRPVSISEIYSIILKISDGKFAEVEEGKLPHFVFSERKRETQSLHIDSHEFSNDVRMVTDGSFKLMEYSDGKQRMFRLPDESSDVIDNPKFREQLICLRDAMEKNRGATMTIKINPLGEGAVDNEAKKKIEERLAALGYL